MQSLAARLRDHAAEPDGQPNRQFDLKMASELLIHLAGLATKVAKPAEVPLHSGRRP
jgi:hypothetical protein